MGPRDGNWSVLDKMSKANLVIFGHLHLLPVGLAKQVHSMAGLMTLEKGYALSVIYLN